MPNLSQLNRQRMIDYLKKIKEEHSDDESLIAINEIETALTEKKFGLVWEKHLEQVDEMMRHNVPVFVESKSREINTNEELPFNFILEGDNLHSLRLLEKTHKGKIDIIYIDPPYNTGATDWKYDNKYVVKEDGYRHSKWLSMMANRMQIAKKLLAPDGVFICAIDENEVATLLLLIEDIFGYEYAADCITVVHNPRGVQGNNFSYVHEYAVFVYKRNQKVISNCEINEEDINWSPLRNWGTESERHDAANCFYPIYVKDEEIVGFGDDITNTDIHPQQTEYDEKNDTYAVYPIDVKGVERKWRYARQTVDSIRHLLRAKQLKNGGYDIELGKNFGSYKTVWTDKKFDANEYGSQLISSMVPNNDFDFPKSIYNTYECLFATTKEKPDAIILDYFAGSGTTGHATLMLNSILGGNRRFILCTNNAIGIKREKEFDKKFGSPSDNPEKWNEYQEKYGIARSITYPRVKAAIKGYVHNKDVKYPIFEKKLTITDLKDNKVLEKVRAVSVEHNNEYEKIDTLIEDGSIKVVGIMKKNTPVKGIAANLKYYQTDFIKKSSCDEDYSVSAELLKHISEMVQLEYAVNLDGKKYALLLSDEDADSFIAEKDNLSECQALFVSTDVLLTSEQHKQLERNGISIFIIPDYYFESELLEVGER